MEKVGGGGGGGGRSEADTKRSRCMPGPDAAVAFPHTETRLSAGVVVGDL